MTETSNEPEEIPIEEIPIEEISETKIETKAETKTIPPPLYTSLNLLKQLKGIKNQSNDPKKFVNSAIGIICGSIVTTIGLLISLLIPIAMIIIGSVYLNDCKINNKIPIWLIVNGSVGSLTIIIKTVLNLYNLIRKNTENKPFKPLSLALVIIGLFLFVWFICGNVWIYSASNKVVYNDPSSLEYCHRTCYLFSFWVITCSYIIAGVICCCCCCVSLIIGCSVGITGLTSS